MLFYSGLSCPHAGLRRVVRLFSLPHRARPIGRTGWRIVFGPGHTPRVHGHRGAAGSAAAVFYAIAHEGRGRTAKGIDGIAFMLDKLVVASLARPSGVA